MFISVDNTLTYYLKENKTLFSRIRKVFGITSSNCKLLHSSPFPRKLYVSWSEAILRFVSFLLTWIFQLQVPSSLWFTVEKKSPLYQFSVHNLAPSTEAYKRSNFYPPKNRKLHSKHPWTVQHRRSCLQAIMAQFFCSFLLHSHLMQFSNKLPSCCTRPKDAVACTCTTTDPSTPPPPPPRFSYIWIIELAVIV